MIGNSKAISVSPSATLIGFSKNSAFFNVWLSGIPFVGIQVIVTSKGGMSKISLLGAMSLSGSKSAKLRFGNSFSFTNKCFCWV